ncbi:hypothetical protein [Bosea sp. TAF32]|uniref:hypothetical protein n=1 Tax=Bosea sp. TAF32 TaxID=3237482 RepID=UPI003F8F635A
MITVEACSDLGTIEGTEFAGRQIRAVGAAVLDAESSARDAVIMLSMAEWQQRNLDERSRRRLELAALGAGIAGIASYEAAREVAFGVAMGAAAAELDLAVFTKPNRRERRRAAKTGELLQ